MGLLLAYGVAALVLGAALFAQQADPGQMFEGVLFVVVGLLATTGGVFWARTQRRGR